MKFLADGMLGNVTRWLRLLGHDVEYEPLKADSELILRSKLEDRVLLTADIELFRLAKRRGLQAMLLKGESAAESLSKLSRKLQLSLVVDELTSRCPKCGSILTGVVKGSIKNKISDRTYQTYDRFWICGNPGCAKIYWRGSHWRRIEQTLVRARET